MIKYTLIYIDIMCNDYFFAQITYKHCPLFILNLEEVRKEVYTKYPSLNNKKNVKLYLSNNKR